MKPVYQVKINGKWETVTKGIYEMAMGYGEEVRVL